LLKWKTSHPQITQITQILIGWFRPRIGQNSKSESV